MAPKNQSSSDGSFRFTVVLPEELGKAFKAFCIQKDRNHSDMGRHMIKKALQELQDNARVFRELPSAVSSGLIPHHEGTERRETPRDAIG